MKVYINQTIDTVTRSLIVKTVHTSNKTRNGASNAFVDDIEFLGGPSDTPLVILNDPMSAHTIALHDRLDAILSAARKNDEKRKYTVTKRDSVGKYSNRFHVRFLGVYLNSWTDELSAWHYVDLDIKQKG